MTLPDEVRIAAVKPRVDRELGVVLGINVVARNIDDVERFIQNLEASGAFSNVRPVDDHPDEQSGMLIASLDAIYTPAAGKPAVRSGGGRR